MQRLTCLSSETAGLDLPSASSRAALIRRTSPLSFLTSPVIRPISFRAIGTNSNAELLVCASTKGGFGRQGLAREQYKSPLVQNTGSVTPKSTRMDAYLF